VELEAEDLLEAGGQRDPVEPEVEALLDGDRLGDPEGVRASVDHDGVGRAAQLVVGDLGGIDERALLGLDLLADPLAYVGAGRPV
jgi:hypothetical protein